MKTRILDFRQRNPSLSLATIAKGFGVSIRTVSRHTRGFKPYAHEQL